MLVGEAGKYIAMIIGIFFAALIMTQQLSIFCGILSRTYGFLSDMRVAEIWVMDPKVQFIDDIKPLQDTVLYRVRGVSGVEWAMPLYKGLLKARLANGLFQSCNVIGVDDATLIGGPGEMVQGRLVDLRKADAIIVDEVGAKTKLAKQGPDGVKIPLRIGDTLELNDRRAVVVGIFRATRTFQSQPVIYTTYTRATLFAPRERKLLSFVIAKAKANVDSQDLIIRIKNQLNLAAYTNDEFKWITMRYFLKYTGIPINFGIAVTLALIIGTAIAGQTFYSFTADNLRYFGTLKAMGASNFMLLKMIVMQAALVGVIGFGLGVGLASCTRFLAAKTELAFKFPWQVMAITGSAVVLICVLSAVICIRKVMKLEPAIVFKI